MRVAAVLAVIAVHLLVMHQVGQGMADFGDDEFRQMLCVEPAVAASGAVEVAAGGGEHVCVQKLRLVAERI
jgi:D-hexose-6-phosphate mutarotase